MKNLDELIDQVHDQESFMEFVRALIADRKDDVKKEMENPTSPYGPSINGWENGSIESYLEASLACMEAWMGRENELPENPSWSSFAKFLYFGKSYE